MSKILEIFNFIANILIIIVFILYFIEDYQYKKRVNKIYKNSEEKKTNNKLENEIKRLTEKLRLQGLRLEDTKKELIEQDKYIDKLKIEYDKKLEFERQIKKEVRDYVSEIIVDETYTKCILEILDKTGDEKNGS